MKRGKLILLLTGILLAGILSCTDPVSMTVPIPVRSYSGAIPIGDLVSVSIDQQNLLVRRINHTTSPAPGSDTGWLPYSALPADDTNAQGFRLLNKAVIDIDHYVLFAEFPGAALIYQVFKRNELTEAFETYGNPEYVVFKETVNKESYRGKPYNWMMMKIAQDRVVDSDMRVGFVAYDTDGDGLMYGSAYSYNRQNMGLTDENVWESLTDIGINITGLEYDADLQANQWWMHGINTGNLANALSTVGTASGTNIVDFGSEWHGGMGLMIPQSGITPAQAAGTYFAVVYEYAKDGEWGEDEDNALVTYYKFQVTAADFKVFEYSHKVDTATPVFSGILEAVAVVRTGPDVDEDPLVIVKFQTRSNNADAASDAVKNAHFCQGAFHVRQDDQMMIVAFDPDARFLAFSMYAGTNDDNRKIRFGLAIRDSNYADLP